MNLLPDWLLNYQRKDFGDDALAGTITAVLLIPQALAYALLAGLPPEVGLYSSVIPPLLYALTGSSRTLAVGPVAVAAVMVAASLSGFAQGDPSRALAGALWLALLSGLFLILFAFFRLGWLSHFVSHPVLNGFSTGAAITIIGTQLPALMGVPLGNHESFMAQMLALGARLSGTNTLILFCGLLTIGLLLLARSSLPRLLQQWGLSPKNAALCARMMPLLLVVTAIILSNTLHGASHMPVVGSIPNGLPLPSLSFLFVPGWQSLMGSALLIALIGYVESLSVARLLALRRRQRIDPDRELMALGVTNVGSAALGGMPVAGGFARSMVNYDAGAKTQLAAIITAGWVALAALAFTGVLSSLPKVILAAIVVVAVTQLIDIKSIFNTWRYDHGDGFAQAVTVVGVLMVGIEPGLLLGIAVALAIYLRRTSNPHIAVMGRVPGTEHFRNVQRHEVETWPDVLFVRIDENLYFANVPHVESRLLSLVADHTEVKSLVLVLSGVAAIDASGLEFLESLVESLESAGITLHISEVKGPVMDQLKQTHFIQRLGEEQIHLSTELAAQRLGAAPAFAQKT